MSRPSNPFVYGVPVLASHFIGREREAGIIFDLITSPTRGNVAISGQLGVGKTSLLRYVVDQDIARGWGLTPDRYILLYLDCQSVDDVTPAGFWQRVLGLLARHEGSKELAPTIERLNAQEEIVLYDVEALLDEIHYDTQKVLVLLLDEFEWMIRINTERNERITRDFLSMLNVLARRTPRNFSLIVATEKPLDRLCGPIGGWRGSPFPSVFLSLSLKPFTQEEAEALIVQALQGTGVEFTAQDQAFVCQESQGHPGRLQNACFMLFAGKLEGLPNEDLCKEISLILREKSAEPGPPEGVVEKKLPPEARGIRVDVASGNVWVEGQLIEPLSALEFRLLRILYKNANKICDKYTIVEKVWREKYLDEVDDARIEKLVSRLRDKVEPDRIHPRYVINMRGRGYKLVTKG